MYKNDYKRDTAMLSAVLERLYGPDAAPGTLGHEWLLTEEKRLMNALSMSANTFRIIPDRPRPERQRPGQRNALRIEYYDCAQPAACCDLQPLTENAARHRKTRPNALHLYYRAFGSCSGKDCRECPIMRQNLSRRNSNVFR